MFLEVIERYSKLIFMFWANASSINETYQAFVENDWTTFIFTMCFAFSLVFMSVIFTKAYSKN